MRFDVGGDGLGVVRVLMGRVERMERGWMGWGWKWRRGEVDGSVVVVAAIVMAAAAMVVVVMVMVLATTAAAACMVLS